MESGNTGLVKRALKTAVRSAIIAFCIVTCMSLVPVVIDGLFGGKWRLNSESILRFSSGAGTLVFLWTFVAIYLSLRASAPAVAVLERTPSLSLSSEQMMSGFVGMEYFALILNRTYVVFSAASGLYGWKARGPVSAAYPQFFQPYQDMLDDPELMCDLAAIEDLSKLSGGFFIRSEDIVDIEASHRTKWGMGPIPHSGRIRIRLARGISREFILLGSVSPEAVRDRILSASEISCL